MYKVRLEQFEGPMDLLVYLIEHARMSIYDIRVSEITSQYLAHVAGMKRRDIAVAQEFMVLAAELIELKSKMLLPGSGEPEEGADDEDPRSALVARILEYRQFREAAAFLAVQQEAAEHSHTKPREDISRYTDEPDELLRSDLEKFAAAFRAFLLRKQRLGEMRRSYERIERQRMSVESRIAQIRELFTLRKKKKMMFSEMITGDKSRFNKVISFMALLEMLKDRRIRAEQKKRFGDISVSLVEGSD